MSDTPVETLRFLAEAARLLWQEALDLDGTLTAVARLAVPYLADWCTVDLVEADGSIRRVALSHVETTTGRRVREFFERHPVHPAARYGVPNVIRTGLPELYAEIPDRWVAAAARGNEAELGLLRGLGLRSAMFVPLVARGRTLGAMGFLTGDSGRRYEPSDLAVAEELTGRAALAIDNARLYGEAQAATERFRRLATHAPVGIFHTDSRGDCVFVNDRWCRIAGLSPEEAAGRGWTRGLHPEDRERVAAEWYGAVAGGREFSAEYRHHTPSGVVTWVSGAAVALRDAAGEISGYLGTITDVTARKRAEEVASRLAAIVDSSDDAIIGKTLEGTIVSWNRAAERLYGYSAAEALGRPISLLLPPDRGDELPALFERLRRGERIHHYETARLHKDGSRLYLSVTISPIRDATGEIVGASAIARDVSERRRTDAERAGLLGREQAARATAEGNLVLLRESEARFRALASAVPGMLFTSRPDGWSDYTSPWFYDYTGMAPGRAQGYGWAAALHPEDRERATEEWAAAVREGQPFQIEYRFRAADGSYRWFLCRTIPIRGDDGRIVKWFGVSIDIDEQKRAERALQEANRAKDEFLATLSHELRTPLNAILGWSQVLAKDRQDVATRSRAVETIARNAKMQARLIDDLLDVSRIVRGRLKLDVREMDLASVIDAGLEGIRPAAEAKGIHVEARLDPEAGPILGDAARLQQVMWNLLTNAVKFTPEGGRVDVRLERRGTGTQITVTDTGEGIAAEFLPHVFERFRQADGSITRTHGGLGLGLALVRHLVELHGGTVTVDSAGVGRGATFAVILPIRVGGSPAADAERRRGEKAAPGRMVLAGIRVLAVDDDPDARELVTAVLQQHGASVTAVASAAEAIEALGRVRPHVLLADLAMPEEDGYSLVQQVRQHEAGRRVAVIAVTALAGPADRQRTGEAGFDRHLAKPVESDELVAAIAELAGRPVV